MGQPHKPALARAATVVNGGGGGDLRGMVGPAVGVRRFLVFFFFRGPRRALQDLYEDWSAIYRNRIPPCLTLPLARALSASLVPHRSLYLPAPPPRHHPSPYPFSLPLSFASLFAGFIQSSAALTLSLSPPLFLCVFVFLTSIPLSVVFDFNYQK